MRYNLGLVGSLSIAYSIAGATCTIAQACAASAIALHHSQKDLSPPAPLLQGEGLGERSDLRQLAQQTTVRILGENGSGSGAIVSRVGQIYTVVTSWHVVAWGDRYTIMTPDGRRYRVVAPRQLGNTDLAIARFRSGINYQVARISTAPPEVGEPVFAAGFPMYQPGTLITTFDRGIRGFRFTVGEVSLLPSKSLAQGYRLGYTNDIAVGMSGGPIFNSQGLLIGINGRVKNRDPGFGVYAFEDGTEPAPEMLEQMVNSSWGIPISTYLQLVSQQHLHPIGPISPQHRMLGLHEQSLPTQANRAQLPISPQHRMLGLHEQSLPTQAIFPSPRRRTSFV
jgi:serine protease Do